MAPQIGDIWDWDKDGDDEGGPILIIEYLYEEAIHGERTKHYRGLELLSGSYDDFIFNASNISYWKKLG